MKDEIRKAKSTSNNHKKQYLFEILLPITIAAVVLLVLFILTTLFVAKGDGQDSRPVDIAIIFIMSILLTIFLISILVSLAISNLLFKANHSLPQFLSKLQIIGERISKQLILFSVIGTMPIIKIRSISTGINRFIDSIRNK